MIAKHPARRRESSCIFPCEPVWQRVSVWTGPILRKKTVLIVSCTYLFLSATTGNNRLRIPSKGDDFYS